MKSGPRRIESIFQECLDAVERGEDLEQVLGDYPGRAEELRKRLETALWLKENGAVLAPRAGFVPASRQRLIGQLRQDGSSRATQPRDARALKAYQLKRFWLTLNLISLVVLVLVLGFVGMQLYSYAETALPGDSLYPVKLLMEKVRLETATDLATRTHLHVEFANRRSGEIIELILEGRFSYLMATSINMQGHVQQADRYLTNLKLSDPSLANALSEQLESIFSTQDLLLKFLVQAVPQDERGGVAEAMAVAVH